MPLVCIDWNSVEIPVNSVEFPAEYKLANDGIVYFTLGYKTEVNSIAINGVPNKAYI